MNKYTIGDIYLGLNHSFQIELDKEKVDSFLQLSGDTNPLHVNAAYAMSKGFKDRVVYGMLVSAFYSTLVGLYIPGEYAILHGIDIQFSKPAFIGDKLSVYGEVSYINEAYKQIEIRAYIKNQDSVKISKALIKVGIIDE